jgi:hypothetical protein
MIVLGRTLYANLLHQMGEGESAPSVDITDEMASDEVDTRFRFAAYLQRYLALEVSLFQGKHKEVISFLDGFLTPDEFRVENSLDYLTLARALLLAANENHTESDSRIGESLDKALEGLQQARNEHLVPRALLTRADYYAKRSMFDEATADVDAAMAIAICDGMQLYQIDCLLAYGAIYLKHGDVQGCEICAAAARPLIDTTGYYRKSEDVIMLGNHSGIRG